MDYAGARRPPRPYALGGDRRLRRQLKTESADEHEESRLVAHDRDVSLAGCSVLQPEHVAGTKLPRLAVSHGNGKAALQDDAELNRGSRMIEPVFQVLGAPTRVESSEEGPCGGK